VIVAKLNQGNNAGLVDSRIMAGVAVVGGMPLGGTPADYGNLVAEETENREKVIKNGSVQLE
jgi:hypothetical protein